MKWYDKRNIDPSTNIEGMQLGVDFNDKPVGMTDAEIEKSIRIQRRLLDIGAQQIDEDEHATKLGYYKSQDDYYADLDKATDLILDDKPLPEDLDNRLKAENEYQNRVWNEYNRMQMKKHKKH